MRVSYRWISELLDLPSKGASPQDLAELLTRRGLEVEEVLPMAQGFDKVITAHLLERGKHPNSDRLSLCKVSTGSGDPIEIVCGAQNMKSGDKVVLAQIGAHIPNGLKIERSKIRDVVSNGMLCSSKELGLGDESDGIIILPADAPVGVSYAEFLGRNDTVLVLKLTANRGDCLSHYGLAREIGAALGLRPKDPKTLQLPQGGSPIEVKITDDPALAPQFHGALIEGVKIGPSPAWVKARLEAAGSRSINNVVDATNLALLELGHPVHAYDADRLKGKTLSVRLSRAGEQLPLLDGQTVECMGTELVIADDEGARAVGLAGVMGGGNTEVADSTTRVFLECAEFSASHVRRAATRHARRTDAAQRFEKGIDPAGAERVLARLAQLVVELAGGKVVGTSRALGPSRSPVRPATAILVTPAYFSSFLGLAPELVTESELKRVFEGLDCKVASQGGSLAVTPPTYRLDLRIREDLAEEVARTVGYDKIPATVPSLSSAPRALSANPLASRWTLIERARDALVEAGLCETINLGFSSSVWLKEFGCQPQVKVLNPLSEELEWMVPSLVPGLVRNALDNQRAHFSADPLSVRLFEIRPTFALEEGEEARVKDRTSTNVIETWKAAWVVSGVRQGSALASDQAEIDYSDFKGTLERLVEGLGAKGIRFLPLSSKAPAWALESLHPGQAIEIWAGGQVAGYAGALHPGLAKRLKSRQPLWAAEVSLDPLFALSRSAAQSRPYRAWSTSMPMERDFALLVKEGINTDKITQIAVKAGKPLAKVARIFDIYRGSQVPEGMTSVAVRVTFYEEGRSLQEAETEAASALILNAWKKDLGAELRG